MKIDFFTLLLIMIFSQPLIAQGPSFDCDLSETNVEKAICTDQKLVELDSRLANSYKIVLSNSSDKNLIRREQYAWVENRNNICENNQDIVNCLIDQYSIRLSQLLAGQAASNEPTSSPAVALANSKPSETPTSPLAAAQAQVETAEIQTPAAAQASSESFTSPGPQQAMEAAGASDDSALVVVEAEGYGVTKIEALNDAWNTAVKLAIGMYLSSRTEVVDGELTELIVTHSRGRVNAYQELSAVHVDNTWKVKILASIERQILKESIEASSSNSIKIDGSQFAALSSTELEKSDKAKQLLENFEESFKFEDFINIELTPKVDRGILNVGLGLTINNNLYKKVFIEDFIKILDQISIEKAITTFSSELIELNRTCTNRSLAMADFISNDIVFKKYFNNSYHIEDNILKNFSFDKSFLFIISINYNTYYIYVLDIDLLQQCKKIFSKLGTDSSSISFKISIQALNNSELLDINSITTNIPRPIYRFLDYGSNKQILEIYPVFDNLQDCFHKFLIDIPLNLKGADLEKITDIRSDLQVIWDN